jgi:hypothetical protein
VSTDKTMANVMAEAQIGLSNANQGRTLAADSAATPRSAIITPPSAMDELFFLGIVD